MVTREEFQKRLWPDTFVDVDHNLNTAINKIREVLGDSAENPRFVETLPRRGYRFIAPVDVDAGLLPAPQGDQQRLRLQPQTNVPTSVSVPRGFRYSAVASGVVIAVLASATFLALKSPEPPSVKQIHQLTNDGAPKASVLTGDGSRVFFTEEMIDGWRIAQVPVTGGEAVPIPLQTADQAEIPQVRDISPNHSEFLVTSRKGFEMDVSLWVSPTAGGAARRLGSLVATDATWSANGQSILYGANGALYVAKADGTNRAN